MDVLSLHSAGFKNVISNSGIALTENQISLIWKFFTDPIICLDGDGSILMHLGSLRTSGLFGRKNLKHIIFNNSCHESVGGQPTYSEDLDFVKISKTFGYKNAYKINNYKNLNKNILRFLKSPGPSLLEIITKKESMKNLKRPKNFNKIKNLFMV